MHRQRGSSMPATILEEATAQVANVRTPEGIIQTPQFLDLCRLVLPVVGKGAKSSSSTHPWTCMFSTDMHLLPCLLQTSWAPPLR